MGHDPASVFEYFKEETSRNVPIVTNASWTDDDQVRRVGLNLLASSSIPESLFLNSAERLRRMGTLPMPKRSLLPRSFVRAVRRVCLFILVRLPPPAMDPHWITAFKRIVNNRNPEAY